MKLRVCHTSPFETRPAHAPPHPSSARMGAAAGVPFSVYLHNNHVLSRSLLDLFGYYPGMILASRNKYELLEKGLNAVCWFGLGMFGPIGVELFVNKKMTQSLRKAFKLPKAMLEKPASFLKQPFKRFAQIGMGSPMQIPFEWLDPTFRKLKPPSQLKHISKQIGVSVKQLNGLLKNPTFRHRVLTNKIRIMAIDLTMFALAGQLMFWGKNLMTEALSHRKGFSGIFKYTSKEYGSQEASDYEAHKKDRFYKSLAAGLAYVVAMPLLVKAAVKSPSKAPLTQFFKNKIPILNYSNAIFMSKWVLLGSVLTNYFVPAFLSCRDANEVRETAWKEGVATSLYFGGDDIIGGLGALAIQKLAKEKLETPLLEPKSKWLLGKFPLARPLMRIYQDAGANSTAYRKARFNSWFSLISAIALLGFATPFINNWYTKKKILSELDSNEKFVSKPYTQKVSKQVSIQRRLEPTLPSAIMKPPYEYQHQNQWQHKYSYNWPVYKAT